MAAAANLREATVAYLDCYDRTSTRQRPGPVPQTDSFLYALLYALNCIFASRANSQRMGWLSAMDQQRPCPKDGKRFEAAEGLSEPARLGPSAAI
jgi:hypothetical protein